MADSAPIKELSVEEVFEKLTTQTSFIDVRSQDEYAEVHAKGTTLMPLDTLGPESIDSLGLDKSAEIFLICRSGKRSMAACEIFKDLGYTNLTNVAGGTLAWVDANLPTG